MRAFVLPTSVLGILMLVNLAGCYDAEIVGTSICYGDNHEEVPCCSGWPNAQPCPPDAGSDAETDAGDDAEADAGDGDGGPIEDASFSCPGQCVVPNSSVWHYAPSYVWFGDEGVPPPPPLAESAWVFWVDVTFAEPACPTCSCVAPTNGCVPPTYGCVPPTSWTAKSTACQDPSASISTPLDAPAGWTGACASENPIAAGTMCDGVPCVRSLVVDPPTLEPCLAEPAMPPEGQALPPPQRKKAIEFPAASIGTCDSLHLCIANPPPGYRLCLVADGAEAEHACPEAWSDRHSGWENVEEQRVCSACNCGAMQGGFCMVRVKGYSDNACGNEQGSMNLMSGGTSGCVDLLPGVALGSKSAEILAHEPGTCAPSGGEVVGGTLTEWPVTYCCLPEIAPAP